MSIEDVLEGRARWAVLDGDCREILPTMPEVDVCIMDPPYSRRVHENAMTSRRTDLPDVADFTCRTKRRIDIGFEYLDAPTRRFVAGWCGSHVRRWTLTFADVESAWLWRLSLEAAGLNYRRTCEWDRLGGAPQFNGMEPAPASEAIVAAHRPGKRHWNGGGRAGRYSFPIVANRFGQRGSRVHPTQKPLELMLALVTDFADTSDIVIDPFCGSGTTLVAAVRMGCRAIGIERKSEFAAVARERLEAEGAGVSLQMARAKQTAMFGGSR